MGRKQDSRGYELFEAALVQEVTQRADFLRQACGADAELLREVEELLAADAVAKSFLQIPGSETRPLGTLGWSTALPSGDRAIEQDFAGQVIAHYCVGRRLGAGGMGEVYLADDLALGRSVALKILRGDMPPAFQERLLWEGEFNARLQHPAIATFYESGVAGQVAFIAMEYVQGTTLRARLAQGRLGEKEVYPLAIALLEAVAHAHAASIAHGDIKPENIMLAGTGLLKLLDFGLALAISEAGDSDFETHRVAGTAGYMSPELVRGGPADVRSDLFAIGAVVYEMVSGRRAFDGETPLERLSSVLHNSPPPLVNAGLEASIWPVLAKAMAPLTNDRFTSAVEFLHAIRGSCSTAQNDPGEHHDFSPPSQGSFAHASSGRSSDTEQDGLCRIARRLLMRSEKGKLDQAAALFQKALELEPRYARALAGLAGVHALRFTFNTESESLATAVDLARQAIKIDPKLAEAFVWLGYALYNQGNDREGYACELRAIELDRDNFLAHYFAPAPLCFSSTRVDALTWLQCFDRHAPQDDPHRWRRNRALVHLREAVRLNPLHCFSWLAQGWCYTELEDFSAAKECLERAIALEGSSPIPTSGVGGYLGECLRRSGELARARAACLAGLEATESTDHIYRDTWRGVCLCSLGRIALDQEDAVAAKAAFTQALLHVRGRPRARAAGHLCVQALAGLSRASAEIDLWREALELNKGRRGYDFRWLWGCSEDVTHFDLAHAAWNLDQSESALRLLARAADYGSAAAARQHDLLARG